MKKILIGLLAVMMVCSIFLGTTASAAVAPPTNFKNSLPGWGTEEAGIIPKYPQNYPPYHNAWTETNGLPNTDFEKGLMYWSTPRKNNPTDNVDILTDDSGNKYLKFNNSSNAWEGIESVPFVENRVKAGSNVVIVFDWKVDPNFQVYLQQIVYTSPDGSKDEPKRIAHNGDAKRNEIIVEGEGGWNTAFCKPDRAIMAYNSAMPNYYFNWGVQICQDTSCEAEIDNLRMGIWNESSGVIYDLDGKVMIDLNNLETQEGEDGLSAEMFPSFDYDVTYEDVYVKGTNNKDKDTQISKNDGNAFIDANGKPTALLWIIIGGGALLLIAGAVAVVLVIVIKKKKSAIPEDEFSDIAAPADTEDTSADTQEE